MLIYVASSDEYVMKFDGKAGSLQGIDHQVHDRITKNHGLVAYSDASWHDSDELGYDMFGYVIYSYTSTLPEDPLLSLRRGSKL